MSDESTQDQPQARKAPAMPSDMKAFNKKLIADFRANHGQWTGPMGGRSLLISRRPARGPERNERPCSVMVAPAIGWS